MQNKSFKKAFEAHKAFYDQLHLACLDGIDMCIDGYIMAMEDDDVEAEAAANFVALWYLLMMSVKTAPVVIKNQPAALRQVATRDEKRER